MSYDLEIVDGKTGEILESPCNHLLRGGTYCAGGTPYLSLNITFNYHEFFKRVFFSDEGIRILDGMSMDISLLFLFTAQSRLKGVPDEDYWKPTEGNAKKALRDLISLALLAPEDAVWTVSC